MEEYPKIGGDYKGLGGTFQLVLSEWLEPLIPPPGWNLPPLDPTEYYITSGDAVQKAEQFRKDAYTYAGKAVKVLNRLDRIPSNKEIAFGKKCWSVVAKANLLKKALLHAKGSAVFLETEWDQGRLICIPKNPRLKNKP